MNKNFITIITTASAVILILLGAKVAIGTPDADTSALGTYKTAKINKIASDEEEDIGVSGRKLHTVTAEGIVDGKTKITVIQEYVSQKDTVSKKISVGDKVVVMQQADGTGDGYWVFNGYSNTVTIVILAALAAILLAAVAGIKSIKAFLKTLFTIAAVLLIIIPSFAFSNAKAGCAVIAFIVMIVVGNFLFPKNISQSVFNSVFIALSTGVATLIALLGCKLIGYNDAFDVSLMASSVSASYVTVPFKSAVLLSVSFLTLMFSETVCPIFTSEKLISASHSDVGTPKLFWMITSAVLSKKSAIIAKTIAAFILGSLPTISLIYMTGHSLTALLNNEFSLFVVGTVLLSTVGCVLSAVLAAAFVKFRLSFGNKKQKDAVREAN